MKLRRSEIFTVILNLLGIACLVYLAVLYFTKAVGEPNPEAMIPMKKWEASGFMMTVGFFPLLIANILAQELLSRRGWGSARLLALLPSLVCFGIVAHLWLPPIINAISGRSVPRLKIQLEQRETSEIHNWALCTNGKVMPLEEAFEPEDAKIWIADCNCFSSELVNGQIVNRVVQTRVKDGDGNELEADEALCSVLQAVADTVDHDILDVMVIVPEKSDCEYYVAVHTNVNWQSPCDFYSYDPREKRLSSRIYCWDNVEVLGVKYEEDAE